MSDSEIAPMPTVSQPKPRTGKGVRVFLERALEDGKKRSKKLRKKRGKPRVRYRGVPPLPTFDFAALADSTAMTEREVAAVLRRSVACLQNWRADPEHLLQWERVAGRCIYTAGNVRKFTKEVTTTK